MLKLPTMPCVIVKSSSATLGNISCTSPKQREEYWKKWKHFTRQQNDAMASLWTNKYLSDISEWQMLQIYTHTSLHCQPTCTCILQSPEWWIQEMIGGMVVKAVRVIWQLAVQQPTSFLGGRMHHLSCMNNCAFHKIQRCHFSNVINMNTTILLIYDYRFFVPKIKVFVFVEF